MKIGIDCRLINTIQNTGISRYTEFLVKYYIDKYGFDSVILISNDFEFKYEKCKVVYTKLKPFNIFHFFKFSKFVESFNFDLFHVPFYSGLNQKINSTTVVTVHDLMYKFVEGFFGKNKVLNHLKIKYFDFLVGRSLKNADKIVAVSETTQNDILKIFGFESTHIPEDSEITVDEDASILARFDLKVNEFYFYCGNNRPHKNLEFIIDVFAKNNLKPLVLAGKGHKNYNNVIATGIVTDEELKSLYKSAKAFIFPSKYEGFGLPILESLQLETMVVASNISAFLEFKSHNIYYFENGSTKDFLDAVGRTLNNDFIKEDSFFENYDKKRIYELNDKMLTDLLN